MWISSDKIIVPAPSIPHFKGLGMRNLQYEIRICQKSHNTVTITVNIKCVVRFFIKQTYFWNFFLRALKGDLFRFFKFPSFTNLTICAVLVVVEHQNDIISCYGWQQPNGLSNGNLRLFTALSRPARPASRDLVYS